MKSKIKGSDYKPLVEKLETFDKKLHWLLPIAKNRKKLYNIDDDEEKDDIIPVSLKMSQDAIEEYTDQFNQNRIPDGINKYKYLYRELNKLYTPIGNPTDPIDIITEQRVHDNFDMIIDNLGDFYSSVSIDGNAKESGMYNVASTCSYKMTPDQQKQREAWANEAEELEKKGTSPQEISEREKNWYNHDAKRFYKENSFDFILETVGVFTNKELLISACDIMINKLNINEFPLKESLTTLKNCYDLTLYNEDYTLGKVIEYILNTDYYHGLKSLTYIGFQKKHPHDTHSTIRLAFKLPTNKSAATQLLTKVCQKGITIYEDIKSKIK